MVLIDIEMPESCYNCWIRKNMGCRIANNSGWLIDRRDEECPLKEQDENIAPIESTTEQKKFADRIGFAVSEFWCGACHFNLVNRPKFCSNCGKKVKWEDD